MYEKIELEQVNIQLDIRTKLGYKGFIEFSDGYRLVVSHETDGFGENLRYYASVEKKTEKDGITSFDVSQGIFCIDLNHAQRACQELVNKKLSEGIEIIQ